MGNNYDNLNGGCTYRGARYYRYFMSNHYLATTWPPPEHLAVLAKLITKIYGEKQDVRGGSEPPW